ncbi:MAG: LLM class flavin-dependent oxidoreductase [Chloroflexi bacterium]|nr:LLM class flavin-dependent oxidoreductase [Chloroflexota bacterium]
MKIGMQLHQERGADAVLDEARLADAQGFDSVWLFDHLMAFRPGMEHAPSEPLETLTLMTAVGAVTRHVRLAFATLNLSFRRPAVLAKMLTTLDQITHGRVICSIGAGWFEDECRAYDIPFVADHDERVAREREIALLFKQLWTHPAPEVTTFEGQYVQVHDLPFNPAPFQRPHPPIWIGGDSPATLGLVRELADGWVMLRGGTRETLSDILQAPEWPRRPMTVTRNATVFVAAEHGAAVEDATRVFESGRAGPAASLEAYLQNAILGTPEACRARIAEIESWGVNYLRVSFPSVEHQRQFAEQLLPLLNAEQPLAVSTTS